MLLEETVDTGTKEPVPDGVFVDAKVEFIDSTLKETPLEDIVDTGTKEPVPDDVLVDATLEFAVDEDSTLKETPLEDMVDTGTNPVPDDVLVDAIVELAVPLNEDDALNVTPVEYGRLEEYTVEDITLKETLLEDMVDMGTKDPVPDSSFVDDAVKLTVMLNDDDTEDPVLEETFPEVAVEFVVELGEDDEKEDPVPDGVLVEAVVEFVVTLEGAPLLDKMEDAIDDPVP